MRINCPCQDTSTYFELNESHQSQWDSLKTEFNRLRNSCKALKFLLPDAQWNKLKDSHYGLDAATHHSICIIAYQDRTLDRITKVLHEFIVDKDVNMQYKIDLKENWFSCYKNDEEKEIELHKHSKIYLGKIYELVVAGFLKDSGFDIKDLAAWNSSSPDIVAQKDDERYLIECKYIGQQNSDFINSLPTKQRLACCFDPEDIFKYIIFKLSEASEQLRKNDSCVNNRVAVVIVDVLNRYKFKHVNLTKLKENHFEGIDDYAIYSVHGYEMTCLETFRTDSVFRVGNTISS